jgi:hypothetical protein
MTKAVLAREAAGLTPQQAARRARIRVAYLRQIEQHGAPFVLAERLARLYRCKIDIFLPVGRGTPTKSARGPRRTRLRADQPTP